MYNYRMASFRPPSAGGVGGGDTSSIYNSRAPVDTSHYLTSSPNNPYTPTTKTIDIQTDSTELCQHMNMATSASTQVIELLLVCHGILELIVTLCGSCDSFMWFICAALFCINGFLCNLGVEAAQVFAFPTDKMYSSLESVHKMRHCVLSCQLR